LIYLLTDGAVSNSNAVIELIRQNCSNKFSTTKVHTFGVGQGADENLVVGCAAAGLGGYSFIYRDEEIEDKVISQLSKASLDYLVINEAKILDEDDNVIYQLPNLPIILRPVKLFFMSDLLQN
jgi:hypothetical protein